MKISSSGKTDVGKRRELNEDSFGIFEELGLFIVADGMGGHAAGEVASAMAVDIMKDYIAGAPAAPDETASESRLVAAIALANEEIYAKSTENPGLKGMGTTVVSALAAGKELTLAHVGDSRAYLYRDGVLTRLTKDHSLVEEMVETGQLSPQKARTHPLRNIVTRALGTKPDVNVDTTTRELMPGDVFLLCSDGLSGMLRDCEISVLISSRMDNLSVCAEVLIDRANSSGGVDNITAVLLKVE
ncbi:MAG: Stp1/IreP family PP2C-type Ser/Thr phosphatase [Nitrospirota bacterium]